MNYSNTYIAFSAVDMITIWLWLMVIMVTCCHIACLVG